MKKIYYCPECKSELEEISGCGAISYFCNTCKKLISKKRILSEDETPGYVPQVSETEE